MNTFVVVLCAALVAIAAGSDWKNYHNRGYQPGFRKLPYGISTPYNNAARVHALNRHAEYIGASSGTAKYYGVPGSGRYFGYRGHFGHNNYGYDRRYLLPINALL